VRLDGAIGIKPAGGVDQRGRAAGNDTALEH
jgi:hypothetical protein